MNEIEKLRVLLPHWIEHNGEHAKEFREWADRAGPAKEHILAAAELVEEANDHLAEALEQVGGPLEQGPMVEEHGHHGHHNHD
jgi:hypothetical protein